MIGEIQVQLHVVYKIIFINFYYIEISLTLNLMTFEITFHHVQNRSWCIYFILFIIVISCTLKIKKYCQNFIKFKIIDLIYVLMNNEKYFI